MIIGNNQQAAMVKSASLLKLGKRDAEILPDGEKMSREFFPLP
jgi:hypothetical protein